MCGKENTEYIEGEQCRGVEHCVAAVAGGRAGGRLGSDGGSTSCRGWQGRVEYTHEIKDETGPPAAIFVL